MRADQHARRWNFGELYHVTAADAAAITTTTTTTDDDDDDILRF